MSPPPSVTLLTAADNWPELTNLNIVHYWTLHQFHQSQPQTISDRRWPMQYAGQPAKDSLYIVYMLVSPQGAVVSLQVELYLWKQRWCSKSCWICSKSLSRETITNSTRECCPRSSCIIIVIKSKTEGTNTTEAFNAAESSDCPKEGWLGCKAGVGVRG